MALSTATWSMTDKLGLYDGLMVRAVCINGPCPPGPPSPPQVPFLAAWPDNRSPGTFSEIWVRKFLP